MRNMPAIAVPATPSQSGVPYPGDQTAFDVLTFLLFDLDISR